jgi:NRAMP (natural resistance-associated macrophage protein)-like metal ion transporter
MGAGDGRLTIRDRARGFLKKVGPGFVTGVADDDPSGIATYSIAGARYGYSMSWMSLFLIPSMVAVQEMCGRIGLVTGEGLAGVIKRHYSRRLMWFAVGLLAVANTINIGADLGIMAASLRMLFGLPYRFWLFLVAVAIIGLEIRVPYRRYSQALKWLGLSLLAYVATAFLAKQDWGAVALATLVPHVDLDMGYLMTLVGFVGTTISPYLFFWQASEEVEEEIAQKKIADFNHEPEVTRQEVRALGADTRVGMVFSNVMTFFILITTAATLHRNGILDIDTPQQAASALRPLAGGLASWLFSFGIIGIGLQSIPVLAGSVGYAVADALGIEEGLAKRFSKARGFYSVLALATVVGLLLDLLGVNTIRALYFAAIVNGVAAVPLIAIIIRMARDRRIVKGYRTSNFHLVVAWLTFAFMAAAVALMAAGLLRFKL